MKAVLNINRFISNVNTMFAHTSQVLELRLVYSQVDIPIYGKTYKESSVIIFSAAKVDIYLKLTTKLLRETVVP